ncbi:hypothetical protein V6R21_02310 [Limibacter armeniacum]|uniref:hypothetical protein n=1 Tax=Limibacter armeniacum TaxID=466084 RepID=UPI002FE549D5
MKYGILDITFKKVGIQKFVKVFCNGEKVGYYNQNFEESVNHKIDLNAYIHNFIRDIDQLFPIAIEVIDCCKTHNEWVWSEKHFYL